MTKSLETRLLIMSTDYHSSLDLIPGGYRFKAVEHLEVIMARQEFRNHLNILVGWRQKQGDHDVGYDNLGRPKGYYEPRFDVTKNINGMIVSRGDTLVTLILAR